VVSRPNTSALYWSPAQMLAHLTVNGASIRPGDLIASGTVSGPGPRDLGCLLELGRGGTRPLPVAGGERSWLLDGDTVTVRGSTRDPDGQPLLLAEVTGTVRPAEPLRVRA
jgi:fumarylacetoacetase